VTAVPVTGTVGPRYTHIALGAEAGLTEYAGGYANVTDLHIIHKPTLRNRLGHVADAEMASLGWAVRMYLGPGLHPAGSVGPPPRCAMLSPPP